MLARGYAYHCYCTPEELRQMREQALAEGRRPATTAAGVTAIRRKRRLGWLRRSG